MKAVVCRSPGDLVLEDRAAPGAPPPGWARVAVSHVGICGTDYHIFEGKHPFLAYPRIMGHEVSGTIAERGEGVGLAIGEAVIVNPYLACGKCIACRHGKPNCCLKIEVLGVHRDGAMCDEILVPAQNLYPANGLSLADAAAVEFLAIGAHAVRRSLGAPGQCTLVIGAGPIGLGTALFARIAGLDVSLLDMSTERLGFAESELGFAALDGSKAPATDLVRQATGGEGFDLVFDATGNTQSVQSAFAHVAHGGTLVLVSVVKDDIAFSDPEFHKREMTLVGSRNALRADFDHVAASIRNGAVPLAKLVTHRTTLAGTPRDLARWAHEKTGLIKAVIEVG
ncbi:MULTISPECIES: zinc-binding alcohol dehydrogenase family protein [unclassified Mesorhizobium]|uniref:zinc-binding alcohol dehydrogenase family protein n=1 Tax=unclassified Mesorhizobium TaxID=325217 RepID=UPI000FCB46DA|nr:MULTISPECIES: zinc-binding alcohol dehydrogenase family protein [unclassified Mesorhizobium]RUW35886.1 zinc-binding alcohol dehydrogenase family protein [Mesorhizobium sp. M1E.F.Ca.ET.041.01.1.1]RWB61266.1 MAG: zinc-binding alcohol dehydrogenase family protein [Mesorhizobium sp.]RWD90183.1 MAG: zinc-binding alcohol dehydrogenase family protein [Mesorhizobium sp.]RWD95711.1 MAG: zinc-binding alcohol dehydrogenase family protein [Mesorhizobium sp.]TKB15587.1 MAG: zinc-binding alcohol dehydrog